MEICYNVVVIKKSGARGGSFGVEKGKTCTFGRNMNCDIRIQLQAVSNEHMMLDYDENGDIIARHLSQVNPTNVNGKPLVNEIKLKHGDRFEIAGRQFEIEVKAPPSTRKNVGFASPLEPQLFDTNMPPNTPLTKGGQPNLRSAKKTRNLINFSPLPSKLNSPIAKARPVMQELAPSNLVKDQSKTPGLSDSAKKAIEVAFEKHEKKKALNTPVRDSIKAGKALRATKKKPLPMEAMEEIANGVELNKVMKKSLNTPIRDSIRKGVSLRSRKVVDEPVVDLPECVSKPESTEVEKPKRSKRPSRRKSTLTEHALISETIEQTSTAPAQTSASAPRIQIPKLDFSSMRVVDLKAELAKMGLPTNGKKAELLQRLKSAVEPSPVERKSPQKVVVNKRKLSVVPEKPDLEVTDVESGSDEVEENVEEKVPHEKSLDVHTLKVVELRAELQQRGLDTKGVKAVLQARLLEAIGSIATEDCSKMNQPVVKKARVSRQQNPIQNDEVNDEGAALPKRRSSRKQPAACSEEEVTKPTRSSRKRATAIKEVVEPRSTRARRSTRS